MAAAASISLWLVPLGCISGSVEPSVDIDTDGSATDSGGDGSPSPSSSSSTSTSPAPDDDTSSDGDGGHPPEPDTGSTTGGEGSSTDEGSSSDGATTDDGGGGEGNVVWTDTTITPTCFLFRDPSSLGETATWVEEGGDVTLTFDASGTVFTGSLGGESIELTSVNTAVYLGDTWQYSEAFAGTIEAGHYVGAWSYTECNMTQEPELCPADGYCEGHAGVDITLPDG